MTVASLDDTGELRNLAEQLRQLNHDPRRPGALDAMLLSVSIGAAVVVAVCLVVLAAAADRFPVDNGRLFLTAAASGTCLAPVLAAMYGVNRVNRRRFRESMEKMSQLAEYVRKLSEARQTASVGYSTCFQQLEIKLDLMAIQIEQLEGKTEKVTEQSHALLSGLVDRVEREMAANQESLPIAAVQELAKDVYRLARRQRKADED